MKKIYIVFISSLLLLLPFGNIRSQEHVKQEISIQGGLGLSGLKFSVDQGDSKQKLGGSIGLGYSYFFNQNFGINTGAEVSFLSSEGKFGSISDIYNTVDSQGESFQFSSTTKNYEETHRTTYLNIPVMGQYQTPVMGDHQFYVALGAKVGIPMSSKYKTNGASVKTSGYYPQYDPSHPLNLEQVVSAGFGDFTSNPVDEKVDLKVSFMLAAELGMKWYINESMSVYTGAYLDYGLNDVSKKHDQNFMIYNQFNPTQYVNNSILESQYTQDGATSKFVDKVVPMSVGLKIRVAFKTIQ